MREYITPEGFPFDHFEEFFPDMVGSHTPEQIVSCGNRAMIYFSRFESPWLHGNKKTYAICLMAAHVIYLADQLKAQTAPEGEGGAGAEAPVGPVTSTSVGGVSVSMQTPPSSNDGEFKWWMNKSPYGQELLALIKASAPKMMFVGSRTPILPLR